MEIPTKYNASEVESKWYSYWMKHDIFILPLDHREPYTIVIPPPNVTGGAYKGHMLNNTIQDVLVRKARLEGKMLVGFLELIMHQLLQKQKVVAKLKAQGIDKNSLTREAFLEHAWEWTNEYVGTLEQLKKLGCSCDWDRVQNLPWMKI